MIDWQAILHAIDHEFGQPTAVRALIAGLVCSWGLTQLLKFVPHLKQYSDQDFRWLVRTLAFCLGALPTMLLWPVTDGLVASLVMAIVVGIVAPIAYTVGIRIVVHFWPWLDGHVSARPDIRLTGGRDEQA